MIARTTEAGSATLPRAQEINATQSNPTLRKGIGRIAAKPKATHGSKSANQPGRSGSFANEDWEFIAWPMVPEIGLNSQPH